MAVPNFFPSVSADVVGVFDDTFRQVFSQARPMKALVRENARTMEHPLEKGQIISDYRIILPIEIEIPVIIMAQDYRDVYQQIRTQFLTSSLLTVQTTSSVYDNMILGEMPHEENPEFYNTLTLFLRFKQVQLVQPATTFAPVDPQNGDTQKLGAQNPAVSTAAPSQSTINSFLAGGG